MELCKVWERRKGRMGGREGAEGSLDFSPKDLLRLVVRRLVRVEGD